MSITLAAQDLCLTQSAVSRQIHALEKLLGVKLFERSYRAIAFTPEGERLFRCADNALQQLQDVMGDLCATHSIRPVTLTASIGVTGLWLLPRLSRFQMLHPGVDIRVSANNRLSDLRNEGIDLAIRYAASSSVPPGAKRLFGESLAPVASPSLGIDGLRNEREFAKLTLLEFDDSDHPWLQWRDWLGVMGWGEAKPRAFLHFNQYDLVIHAALAGQGVALGRRELISPLLDDGRLREISVPRDAGQGSHAYWLIQAEERARQDVCNVAKWIEQEARGVSLPSSA